MPTASSALKLQITEDMKAAMRSGEKGKLSTIRLIQSAIKQIEVDTRQDLSDDDIIAILDKMAKQRRESIQAFDAAGRDDLANQERTELEFIQSYLPEQLSQAEIEQLVQDTIKNVNAGSIKDMGKVMGQLKPKLQGRADMASVSATIKAKLSA